MANEKKTIIIEIRADAKDTVKTSQQAKKVVDEATKSIDTAGKSLKDLNQLIKEYTNAAIKAGEHTPIGKEFLNRAAEIKDRVGDIKATVKNLASDTLTLDVFARGVTTIASAYGVAASAGALFGDENKDLQKTMMKVQAALTLVNSLQAIQNNLQRESVLRFRLAAAAQALWTVVTNGSSIALRFLGITSQTTAKVISGALIATGIGALIVALGILIANIGHVREWLDRLANKVDFLAKKFPILGKIIDGIKWAFEKLAEPVREFAKMAGLVDTAWEKSIKNTIKNIDDVLDALDKRFDHEKNIIETLGGKTEEVERRKLKATKYAINEAIAALLTKKDIEGKLNDDDIKKLDELNGKKSDAINGLSILELKIKKQSIDAEKKLANDILKVQTEKNKKSVDLEKQRIAQFNKEYDAYLMLLRQQLEDSAKKEAELFFENERKRLEFLKTFGKSELEIKIQQLHDERDALLSNELFTQQELHRIRVLFAEQENGLLAQQRQLEERGRQESRDAKDAELKQDRERIKAETASRVDAIESMVNSFATISRGNDDAQKASAVALATINTYQGATKALAAYPPPFNIAAAAFTVAAGLANVNRIITTDIPGAATGLLVGSEGAPIRRGNGDNMLITAKRGEVVLNDRQQALLGGRETFSRIGVPGFAAGGLIDGGNTIGNATSAGTSSVDGLNAFIQAAKAMPPPILDVRDFVSAEAKNKRVDVLSTI